MKMPWVHITSNTKTWLKKYPEAVQDLKSDDKAQVSSNRTINRCQILKRTSDHTFLRLGFGLGDWWISNEDWTGLDGESIPINRQFLGDVPYIYQVMDDIGWNQSQSVSITMCLKYMQIDNINSHNNYLELVNKYGKSESRFANHKALRELNVGATFSSSSDDIDVKTEIDKGLPVVAGILMRGHITKPVGMPHFVVVTGYNETSWKVHDPFGVLDLEEGKWLDRGINSGKAIEYDFELFNRRFMYEGGSTGRLWSHFERKVQ